MHGGAEYNLMAGLGKQAKGREQGQAGQGGQAQGGGAVLQQQHHYLGGPHGGGSGGGVLVGGKGVEGATSQGFSMSMAAAMNRGASVGPGPLGLAPVASVMAPQGHAMIQSMAEGGRGGGGGSSHGAMGGGSGHPSMMQQQQQHHHQMMQLHHAAAAAQHAQAQQSQQQVRVGGCGALGGRESCGCGFGCVGAGGGWRCGWEWEKFRRDRSGG
jgi:hypothetical protein